MIFGCRVTKKQHVWKKNCCFRLPDDEDAMMIMLNNDDDDDDRDAQIKIKQKM